MKRESLYDAITDIKESLILQAEQKRKRPFLKWAAPVAAAVAVVLLFGMVLWPESQPFEGDIAVIAQAEYPSYIANNSIDEEEIGNLRRFTQKTAPVILSGEDGTNKVFSPLNLYFSTGLLAQISGGESRKQLLTLFESRSAQEVLEEGQKIWEGTFRQESITPTTLANSIWLSNGKSYNEDTLSRLAEELYVSSYRGNMGSREYDQTFQKWLCNQTGGLLEDYADQKGFSPNTTLSLVSTIHYAAVWGEPFDEEKTESGIFYTPKGAFPCDFMVNKVYVGLRETDLFTAVCIPVGDGDSAWFILPKDKQTPESLLCQDAIHQLLSDPNRDDGLTEVKLYLPKFDCTNEINLTSVLKKLGMDQITDSGTADFSPILSDPAPILTASQSVRLKVDENGIEGTSAASSDLDALGSSLGEPKELKIDRPFLMAVTNRDSLPLFMGIINHPDP